MGRRLSAGGGFSAGAIDVSVERSPEKSAITPKIEVRLLQDEEGASSSTILQYALSSPFCPQRGRRGVGGMRVLVTKRSESPSDGVGNDFTKKIGIGALLKNYQTTKTLKV